MWHARSRPARRSDIPLAVRADGEGTASMILPSDHQPHAPRDRAARTGPRDGHETRRSPHDDSARSGALHLASAYLRTALVLSFEAPGAHAVVLLVDGDLRREAARARLVMDPNVCDVDASGVRIARTRLAPRSQPVALTRLRAEDPSRTGRTRFAITGAGLRDGLALVVSAEGEHFHLELGDAFAALHRRTSRADGAARAS